MQVASAARRSADTSLLERARVAFFRAFFPMLLGAIAVSEWLVVARAATRLVAPVPIPLHVLGPFAFYAGNRWLMRRLRAGATSRAVSLYTAFAFTCVFCGVFLAFAELAWLVARIAVAPATLA